VKRSLITGFILFAVLAIVPASVFAEEPMSPHALEISNKLNCPVCEGQSVRDSNSQLARDMRRTVQELLDAGYTEDEVYDYFVDRYGVGILREPPKSGFFMTLWWAPVIGIAIGALVLGTFLTQRKKPGNANKSSSDSDAADTSSDDDLSEYEQRVLQDLDDDAYSDRRR
jgi:cytochrome c-type biogenesis protein CcmH/NrfF